MSATLSNNIIIADGQGNRRINVDNNGYVGINTTSPSGYLNVKTSNIAGREVVMGDTAAVSGVFRARLDDNSLSFVQLENRDTAATTNHGVGIRFNLGTSVSNNAIDAGGVYLIKEQQWTATATTQDSALRFFTTLDGTAAEKMRIASSGNVGINTVTPSTTLEVVGTITCTTLVETSSVATKTNVKKLNSQTAKLSKLVPVSFNYKNNNKRSLGLIAEEVANVYPELVEYDKGQPLGVNYSKLTAVLISAVNELAAEVAELKKQLNK